MSAATPSQIPQPPGWGLFIPTYITMPTRNSLKSPNLPIGDCSFLPTSQCWPRLLPKSPNRQVGDCSFLPTSRCRHETVLNPQPAGWELFISAYNPQPP